VVYDERSGDTHLLEPVAAAAIRTLEAAPATADEWIACVTARLGIAPDDELRGRFAELIARFDELGLIVADAPEPPHAD